MHPKRKATYPATLFRIIENRASLGDRDTLMLLADNALNRMNAAPPGSRRRALWSQIAAAFAQRSVAVGIRLGKCKGSLETALRFEKQSEKNLDKVYAMTRGKEATT